MDLFIHLEAKTSWCEQVEMSKEKTVLLYSIPVRLHAERKAFNAENIEW